MVVYGVLMNIQVFSLTSAQLNIINIGAAIITLSTTFIKITTKKASFEKINKIFLRFSKFNFLMGLLIVLFGVSLRGFNQNSLLVSVFSNLDSNPLVLICLGITIASIANISLNNSQELVKENIETRTELNKMMNENKLLKSEIVEATKFINELKEGKKK